MAEVGPKIGVVDFEPDGATYGDDVRKLFRMLQGLVQANVIDVTLTDPPASPANGDTYAVAVGGTGAWAGQDNSIAYWTTADPNVPSGKWDFYAPLEGWLIFNALDGKFYWFNSVTPAWEVAFTPGGGGGGVPIYDRNGNIPASGDNHIVADVVSSGYGQTTVTLTGSAVFSDNTRYTVVAVLTRGSPSGIPLPINDISRDSGSNFTVYSSADPGGNNLFFVAIGLFKAPS